MTGFERLSDDALLTLHAAQTENRRWAVDAQAGLVPMPADAKTAPSSTWELAGLLRELLAAELRARGVVVPEDEFDGVQAGVSLIQ